MLYTWVDAAIAATIAIAAVAAAFALDAWQRRTRLRRRAADRAAGAAGYAPLHDVPRNVDLALEIADHLRLKYSPLIRAGAGVSEALRVSLRAATVVARMTNVTD